MVFLLIVVASISFSCRDSYTPHPYGYFRIYLPEHEYKIADTLNLPYQFYISNTARIKTRPAEGEMYWIDILYPQLNGSIHCSYKGIDNNLFELSEDARRFVYAHSNIADGINEHYFEHPEKSVYGVLYDLQGNVASPVQFVVTDSVKHFFRGALYFNNKPNKDSIAPVVSYVRTDIVRLMESFEWER
ncbi:gliding motility lipoprotein GldD [Paludibacter sp. 221]|nr:gliding motility lipoprotein GldD [Paludibacter sp. 221]